MKISDGKMSTEDQWIANRVNLPTAKGSADISRDIPARIRSQAFFSAKVADAHILDRFRAISDAYSTGKIGRGEATNLMLQYGRAAGKDDGTRGIANLCSLARLHLILDQNASMAHAVGEYERMYSESALRVFPYVLYHASAGSKQPRESHQQYNGMIFRKDDPWLRAHWPPWDFGCHCRLEQISEKRAQKNANMIQPPTPLSQLQPPPSGFEFDPSHAFEFQNTTALHPMSRAAVLKQAEEAVRDQRLGNVGLIVAPAQTGAVPAPLPNIAKVKDGFVRMAAEARKELVAVGLDPDHLPDYNAVNQAFENAQKQGKNIPGNVLQHFPQTPFEVAPLNHRAAEAAGLPDDVPVMLGRGNDHHGIQHLWRNHKEIFVDSDTAVRLLRETLGDPNCRVVVSLKRGMARVRVNQQTQKNPICLKRIVLHNPQTQTYCVMVYDGTELRLVSWNNAGDNYGDLEWTLK